MMVKQLSDEGEVIWSVIQPGLASNPLERKDHEVLWKVILDQENLPFFFTVNKFIWP